MNITYHEKFPSGMEFSALQLFITTLGEKLLPIFGDKEQAVNVLIKNLSIENTLIAMYDQKVVGILAIQTHKRSFLNPTIKTMVNEYGILKGFYRYAKALLLYHKVNVDEWHIEGIAVSEEMRGLGIGAELIQLMENNARKNGIKKITLDVINTNPKAKKLYERLGFIKTKEVYISPFNWIYGFKFQSVTGMTKFLSS